VIKLLSILNEIKVVPDILSKIKQKLLSLKKGDKVKYTAVDGEIIEGIIHYFKEYKGDGSLVIRTPGKFFHRDTSIYVDFTNKVNNRTSQSFYTLEKI